MSKRAACLQRITNAREKLLQLDWEMIQLEDALRSPEAMTREGVLDVLHALTGLRRALEDQAEYACQLEGIPLYATKEP